MLRTAPPHSPPRHVRRPRTLVRPALAVLVVVALLALLGLAYWGDSRSIRETGAPATGAGPGVTPGAAPPSGAASPTGRPSPPASASPTAGASRCRSGSVVGPSACPGPSAAPAGPKPPIRAPAGKRWELTFGEEFNGTDYDHSKLTPCFDWNDGDCTATFNNGREYYQPSQVKVSNGTAKLTARPAATPIPSSACQNGSCTYVSGMLSTARSTAGAGQPYLYTFRYGFVEARLKVPATRGFFTAFWMLPADRSYSYRNEIDILEMLGDDPTTMFMTYHYQDRAQSYAVNKGKHNNGACRVKNYSKKFVDMGVDWEPNRIAWYIDGVKCGQFTNRSQIENGPMQIILNLMVDVDWQRQWGVGLTNATLTRQLEVDYLRVYQQRPA